MGKAITITPELDVTVIDFPSDSEKQYRIVSSFVKSGEKGDHGLVEQVSFPMLGRSWHLLLNEEGLIRSLTYNGLATFIYLDALGDKELRYTPILTGNAVLVQRSRTGEWMPINETALPGALALIDQIKAEIGGVRAATIEELS